MRDEEEAGVRVVRTPGCGGRLRVARGPQPPAGPARRARGGAGGRTARRRVRGLRPPPRGGRWLGRVAAAMGTMGAASRRRTKRRRRPQ